MFLLNDKKWRIIDFIGHCTFALILPGHFYWQFLPDIFIPFCIIYSIVWNGYKPIEPLEKVSSGSVLLKLHQSLHTIYAPVIIGLLCGWNPFIQCLVHVVWDQLTHKEKWQRKSLWKIGIKQ